MEIKINGPKLEQIANELNDIYFDIENSITYLEKTSKVINKSDFKTILANNPTIRKKIKIIKKEINILFESVEEKSKKSFQINLGDSYENKS